MTPQVIGPFEGCGTCVLTLVNVTATADMRCPIDLKTVVMRARNAEYNPKRFSACVSHVRERERERESESTQPTNCCSWISANLPITSCAAAGSGRGFRATPNYLYLSLLSTPINQCQIIRLINKHEPKATALVFKTGKVVVTGSKSNASVDYACKTFARILSKLDNGSGGPAPSINFK